ncbi:MAG: glycosyltransferase family 4 protein [Brevefilum sp.]
MMEAVGSDLKAILVNDSGNEKKWRDHVPIYSLINKPKDIRYLSHIFKLLGFALKKDCPPKNRVIRKIIKKHAITHILCQYGTFAVQFMDVWRITDSAIFVHFHGFDQTFDLRGYDPPGKNRFNEDYKKEIISLSHRAIFIVNSIFSKNMLINAGIHPNRIILKYFGTPLPSNQKKHKNIDKVKIIHLGRLVDCKSPDRTIKAFEIAKEMGLQGTLWIVGDGPLRVFCELLRQRSKFKEDIHIFGAVSWLEAQQILSTADIFTQHNIKGEITQQSEAFGVSILEAMSYGLPIVGTRSGGVTETVIDGETGILVEPGDTIGQADALIKLANQPELRQKMGDAGRERIVNYFSVERETIQLREILRISDTRSK